MPIAYILTGFAGLALAFVTWRKVGSQVLRAALVVIAAAGLSVILSGNLLSAALIGVDLALIGGTWTLTRGERMKSPLGLAWIGLLILALLIAKLPPLQASLGPAVWIGVSYLIFRLIHVALDARRDRLKGETLPESIVYALHPTTLAAGPIDRIQHSVAEQCADPRPPAPEFSEGLWRLFIGLFKKAAVANVLYAFIAQHDMARQPDQPTLVAWLWLISYALYLYFDFAAYSDIVIGVGRMMGIHLPENFTNPYAQSNLAKFWQSWHITLTNWLRDYIFFPMSRGLLKRYGQQRAAPILLASHVTTMVACGLWHGLGTGFVAWGVWHGLGLFGYSQVPSLRRRFGFPALPAALGLALTFAFVTLGWVFFSTDLPTALRIYGRLFGVS
ncbi:MAG TPA: MBOAT family O-acyltransferase [Aggregatilineales bacterium]|nr:MBOAT family O-acyltransferase [Aggregatilineales bacterium]